MRIFAFHLLNDFSGSPKVLSQLAKGWLTAGLEIHMVTSLNQKGFLSGIKGIKYHEIPYTWSRYKILKMLRYFFAQLQIYWKLHRLIRPNDLIYVNTILPIGAAILGKLKGCRIIYHIHETSVKPKWMKALLVKTLKATADSIIFVSNAIEEQKEIEPERVFILPNAIEDEFLLKAQATPEQSTFRRNVLMICSLKAYKGVYEFFDLAHKMPEYDFRLILNADWNDIHLFFKGRTLPLNLELFATQEDLHSHYHWADLMLNLSRPTEWVETFGLTILEGMAYGLPALVPPVGGIAELLEDGVQGFHVSSSDQKKVCYLIRYILNNQHVYNIMRNEALERVEAFREEDFIQQNLSILNRSISELFISRI